ncbi:MAG: 50S ribosomal protein L34e [Methanomicrobia archaeon]|jgi:large subunit ribosomal protein L34e|nr:50S ribosomal protein L34e [Methanomicrobia archaeon]MCK4310215.1 50S ribosomal protein L34e [Methanomicrobia archaeon]MCK4432557.1 50S ribosomal protein L34e [Methanomicrobia archaeon]MCK4636810.1 50S ribosomal protein L34e [Methanomicrobia archaeon]
MRGMYRSRSLKRKFVRTPGGKTVLRFKKKKHSKHKCAECGAELHGVPRKTPNEIKKLNKSKRIPTRPYAGYLCSSCMRKLIKEKVRVEL